MLGDQTQNQWTYDPHGSDFNARVGRLLAGGQDLQVRAEGFDTRTLAAWQIWAWEIGAWLVDLYDIAFPKAGAATDADAAGSLTIATNAAFVCLQATMKAKALDTLTSNIAFENNEKQSRGSVNMDAANAINQPSSSGRREPDGTGYVWVRPCACEHVPVRARVAGQPACTSTMLVPGGGSLPASRAITGPCAFRSVQARHKDHDESCHPGLTAHTLPSIHVQVDEQGGYMGDLPQPDKLGGLTSTSASPHGTLNRTQATYASMGTVQRSMHMWRRVNAGCVESTMHWKEPTYKDHFSHNDKEADKPNKRHYMQKTEFSAYTEAKVKQGGPMVDR